MNPESVTQPTSNRLRPETIATRLSQLEMRAVDAAVGAAGTTRSTWLREAVLTHLGRPAPTLPLSLEPTILQETMGIRYLILNLFARMNPGLGLRALNDVMAIADKGKHGAAARVLDSPGENPTP
jgi:hypothetical protein